MRHWLLIDADDTLWENNVYFEEAFEQFVRYLDHSRLSPAEVRQVLDDIETANIKLHGYGSANFGGNLQECFQKLAERLAAALLRGHCGSQTCYTTAEKRTRTLRRAQENFRNFKDLGGHDRSQPGKGLGRRRHRQSPPPDPRRSLAARGRHSAWRPASLFSDRSHRPCW